jgi:hypothetical protein
MTQITLRGMEPALEQEIRKLAKKSGKSLNHVILDMISQHTGFNKKSKGPAAESLRKLAGGWDEEYAHKFMASIKSCEQIDEEMWK